MLDSAIVLAGGKSSRMGRDKALISFCNQTSLAQYQYSKLKRVFKNVYVVAKSKKFDFSCEVILDRYQQSSPLVAIVSALEELDINELFVLSVDTPFVNEKVICKILKKYMESEAKPDILLAKSSNGLEPLCGVYSSEILPYAKKMIDSNSHRLKSLMESLEVQTIDIDEGTYFFNINTPHDYDLATRSLIH